MLRTKFWYRCLDHLLSLRLSIRLFVNTMTQNQKRKLLQPTQGVKSEVELRKYATEVN